MVTTQLSAHDRLVHEIAERYSRQGYTVQIAPTEKEMPSFLHGFKPDLVIPTSEGGIVAEVKTKGKVRRIDYWERLKSVIDAQPGWILRLILDNRREAELLNLEQPTLSDEEMETRLQASQSLADSGLLDSALLVLWPTLETALREASRAEGLKSPEQDAATLITILYTDGSLTREDYDLLMQLVQVRDQATHGFHVEDLNRSLIDNAQEVVRRLRSQIAVQ